MTTTRTSADAALPVPPPVMGYNTYFDGVFKTDRPVSSHTISKLTDWGWEFEKDNETLYCDGGKMGDYVADILKMAVYFVEEGYSLTGLIKYQGEETGDCGKIELTSECMKVTRVNLDVDKFEVTVYSLVKE
jgi:hypothetical protein